MGQQDTEQEKAKTTDAKQDESLNEEKAAQKKEVNKIVKYHVLGSTGIGCIPLPIVDFIALTATQVNMLRQLANAYDVPFKKDKVKNIIGALIGGTAPGYVAGGVASLVKAIPVVGQIGGMITMPAISGATTYAVGKVFIKHFESGGTFLNFNPDEVKDYYEKMFEEGKRVASGTKK